MYWLILGQSPPYWSCLDLWGLWLSICLKTTLDHTVFKTPRFLWVKTWPAIVTPMIFFLVLIPYKCKELNETFTNGLLIFQNLYRPYQNNLEKKISLLNLYPENNDIFVNYGYFLFQFIAQCITKYLRP